MLTNSPFLWKTVSVDTSHLLILTFRFPELWSIRIYVKPFFAFFLPIGWMCWPFWFPKVTRDAVGIVRLPLLWTLAILQKRGLVFGWKLTEDSWIGSKPLDNGSGLRWKVSEQSVPLRRLLGYYPKQCRGSEFRIQIRFRAKNLGSDGIQVFRTFF